MLLGSLNPRGNFPSDCADALRLSGCSPQLKILVEEDSFKVAVDGTHLLEYEHRAGGLEDVTLLRVTGDLILYSAAPSMI